MELDCKLGASLYNLCTLERLTRRGFINTIMRGATASVLAGACGGVYASLIEPFWLSVEDVEIPLSGLSPALDGFRVLQISDLHCGPDLGPKELGRAVDVVAEQKPDLVVVTGDLVYRAIDRILLCKQELSRLVGIAPVIACLGNHDHWNGADLVAAILETAGVIVLRNESREVAEGLRVVGLDDVWEDYADLDSGLSEVRPDECVLLLVHEPDFADTVAQDGRVDLQVSGHSHGGQVRFPFVGPLIVPYLGRKYVSGLYQCGAMWLYVNRGLGMTRPAIRFNCRPEVTLLTLRCTES